MELNAATSGLTIWFCVFKMFLWEVSILCFLGLLISVCVYVVLEFGIFWEMGFLFDLCRVIYLAAYELKPCYLCLYK